MKQLVEALLLAKQAEAEAKSVRLQAEQSLLDTLHADKQEGTYTTACDGYKVAATYKLTRKLDVSSYEDLDLPENLQFVDYKPAINLKRMRAIEMVDPQLVATCITARPAKTSIKITEVE